MYLYVCSACYVDLCLIWFAVVGVVWCVLVFIGWVGFGLSLACDCAFICG